jgi:hypothetical protein
MSNNISSVFSEEELELVRMGRALLEPAMQVLDELAFYWFQCAQYHGAFLGTDKKEARTAALNVAEVFLSIYLCECRSGIPKGKTGFCWECQLDPV